MVKTNSVDLELPFDEAATLQLRKEWIAEQKMDGIRAVLDDGRLRLPHTTLIPSGPLPAVWTQHILDGCLVGKIYFVFDVLMFNGADVRMRPLHERRNLMHSLTLPSWCRFVPCGKNIGEFLETVIHHGGSGIVLKKLSEPYGQGEWIKVNCPSLNWQPCEATSA